MYLGIKTICLGDRKSFLERLDTFLASEAVVPVEVSRHRIGAIEIIVWEARLKEGVILIEHDPLLGKSLTGPHQLVDRIAMLVFGITP